MNENYDYEGQLNWVKRAMEVLVRHSDCEIEWDEVMRILGNMGYSAIDLGDEDYALTIRFDAMAVK